MHALVIEERAGYPWAVKGTTLRCVFGLGFERVDEEALVFTQWATSADPPEAMNACGTWRTELNPTSADALDVRVFHAGGGVLMHGTLQRADGSPDAASSPEPSVPD